MYLLKFTLAVTNMLALTLAPYGDIGTGFNPKAFQDAGIKMFTLAFANADCSTFQPVWGQGMKLDSQLGFVDQVRKAGGDVIISFGGALQSSKGSMPAVCAARSGKSVQELAQMYQTFIDMYKVTWIDLDIESGNQGDTASVKLRNQAMAVIKQKNPSLTISYTLPVATSGLLEESLALLRDSKDKFPLDVVNLMTMNYVNGPDGYTSFLGRIAIDAAKKTKKQLESIGLSSLIGITPMTGVNDVVKEVFSLENAKEVVEYASNDASIAFLSFWSVNQDSKLEYTREFVKAKTGSLSVPASNDGPDSKGTVEQTIIPPAKVERPDFQCQLGWKMHCSSSSTYEECVPAVSGNNLGEWVTVSCPAGQKCYEIINGGVACG